MIGPGNNQPFRPNNPGHSHGPGQLGQLLGQNVETIIIGPGDDNVGNGGLHITQVFPTPSSHANNFFFNYPGHYNISLGNDVSSGRPQAHLGQLARFAPTNTGPLQYITPTTVGPSGFFGAGAAPAQNRGVSTPTTTANVIGNHVNGPTSTPTEGRPPFMRVSSSGLPNGPCAD